MDIERRLRIENALWGLFIGDSLAMPAHWFYSLDNIWKTFGGGLTGFEAAPHPHPESFMVGMGYHPDVARAEALGRPYDILHDQIRYYHTSYSRLEIQASERESEHGNSTPKLEERYHYHHGLGAGENTVAAHVARMLLRTVAEAGRYDAYALLENWVQFFTTPGNHPDPYLEIYIRSWFENFSRGMPIHACAEEQRRVWSIGSHGGMILPMVVSLLAASSYQGLGFALEQQNLTHRSENVAGALGVAVPLLQDLLAGQDPMEASIWWARDARVPEVTGEAMFQMYRDHQGPGNIPHRQMWELHTRLSETPFDLEELAKQAPEEVVLKQLGTACYPEHGLPLSLYFAAHHEFDLKAALLGNANAGGDNVHRNAVLGLILGAAQGVPIDEDLKRGLLHYEAIAEEIGGYVEVASRSFPW